ncbi:unnamed protein product [Auanema sp. JU1783]|nr:unnamed protein product [Auanema sp. JU1783]
MEGVVFQRAEGILHKLILFQREGKCIKSILDVLYYLLEEGLPMTTQEEWEAVRTAVLVTLRIVAYDAVSKSKWGEHGSKIFQIIGVVCERTENTKCSLKWGEHIKPLLSCLLSVTPKENSDVDLFSTGLLRLMIMVSRMRLCWEEIGKPEGLPIFGALVYACIEIAADKSNNCDSRMNCLKIIRLLVSDDEYLHLQGCSTVIPGLLAKLIEVSTNPTENIKIVEESIDVITEYILYGFNDQVVGITEFPESSVLEKKKLNIQRSEEWMNIARSKLQSSVSLLISRSCSHRDAIIREKIFNSTYTIHNKCGVFFRETLDNSLFDLVLLLCRDPFDRIAENVHIHLETIKKEKSSRFSRYMYEKTVSISEKLPNAIRQSSQTTTSFAQMSSLITCLGSELGILLSSRNPSSVQLIRSLASTIRVDTKRLSVSRNFKTLPIKEIILSLPLQFGVGMDDIASICKEISAVACDEALDALLTEIANCDLSDKIAFSIISLLILETQFVKDRISPDTVSLCVEHFLVEVDGIRIPQYIRDDKVEDATETPPKETVLSITSLCVLASCSKHLFEGSTSKKLLINGLYKLLQLTYHPNWLIKDSAESCLNVLAEHSEKQVSDYMLTNAVYIVNRITLAMRSSFYANHYVEAPLALAAFLDVVNDSKMFEHVQFVTKSMLNGLESFYQQWTLGVLRALRSYMKAMNRWFPDLEEEIVFEEPPEPKSIPEDDINDYHPVEVERLPLPPAACSVESVLKMTKHLLSSPHIPVQIVVTEILREGLHFLRNFENTLLPMVHQNWVTLIRRFDKEEFDVWRVSILVIHEMAIVSNTFVSQRIIRELWPQLNKWLVKEAKTKSFFVYSSRFKLLETILKTLPDIFIRIDIGKEDWESARPTIENFTEAHVHPHIRSLAVQFLDTQNSSMRVNNTGS